MNNKGQGAGGKGQVKAYGYLLLAIISAIFLILAFPPFNMWILTWIAFVPLFFAVEGQGPLKAFLISCLAGFLFFLGTIYWLVHVTLPGMLVMVAYLALYFGLFGLVLRYYLLITNYSILILIPAAWVALEWLRSHALTGFGWALLGYSQSPNLPIIQIADVSGVYGVSFIIAMFNVAVFLTIKNIKDKKSDTIPFVISTVLILVVLGYGIFRLNNIFTGEKINVTVVQGNIPQDKKWDRGFRDSIIDKYMRLATESAEEGKADLIVWPETAVPGFLEDEEELSDKIGSLALDLDTPILTGAPRCEDTDKGTLYFNSAFLLAKDGNIAGHYDKIHLVPFGEYVPFKDALFFVHRFARRPIGDYTAGKDFTVFSFLTKRSAHGKDYRMNFIKKVNFSCLICFEDIFPFLAREFVRKGADFLINITNDAWFGRSPAAYQHAQASVFRAVENRVNVIRAANTGLSCFIDQKGRITSRVGDGGKDLFIEGFRSREIVLTPARTIYNMYGDVFAYTCLFFTVLQLTRSLRARFFQGGNR